MTTGRINQVASALPRASSPAGRAPVRRRDVAFRRRCGGERKGETGGSSRDPHEPGTAAPAPAPPLSPPAPPSARLAAGGQRGVPPRRPSGRDPLCPNEFTGAPRGAVDVPGMCLARPRPGRFRGERLTKPPSARTAAPPAAPGARPAAIGPRNPSVAVGTDDAAPPLGDPRTGAPGGLRGCPQPPPGRPQGPARCSRRPSRPAARASRRATSRRAAPREAAGGATSHRYRAVAARLYNGPRRPRRTQETMHTGPAGPRGRRGACGDFPLLAGWLRKPGNEPRRANPRDHLNALDRRPRRPGGLPCGGRRSEPPQEVKTSYAAGPFARLPHISTDHLGSPGTRESNSPREKKFRQIRKRRGCPQPCSRPQNGAHGWQGF